MEEKNRNKQVVQFADELDRLTNHVRHEYDMSYAKVIGTLLMKVILLSLECRDREDDIKD